MYIDRQINFGKAFWLPKIPCIYGMLLLPVFLWAALLPIYGIRYFHVVLSAIYAVLNVISVLSLIRHKKSESLIYAALHWLFVLLIFIVVFILYHTINNVPLDIMLMALPFIGPFIPFGFFSNSAVVAAALIAYAAVLSTTCIVGIFTVKRRAQETT